MNSRQRVVASLCREPVDQIPLDLGGTSCSSIHALAYQRLRARLGLADGPVNCGCPGQLIVQADRDLMDLLGVDVEALWFGSTRTKVWNAPFGVDLVPYDL